MRVVTLWAGFDIRKIIEHGTTLSDFTIILAFLKPFENGINPYLAIFFLFSQTEEI